MRWSGWQLSTAPTSLVRSSPAHSLLLHCSVIRILPHAGRAARSRSTPRPERARGR